MFKLEHLDPGERSRVVYEEFSGYEKPPLVPVRDLSDPDFFLPFDVGTSGLGRSVAVTFARLTGFARFMRTLPDSLEERLRKTNLRLPGVFAPVISATGALQDDARTQDPFLRAATLVWAARTLHDDLTSGTLPQDTSRGQPLEMGQYGNLFGTSIALDGRRVRIFKSRDLDHILVLIRGRMYVVELLSLAPHELALELAALEKDSRQGAPHASPGILTCVRNQTQLRAFKQLQRRAVNRESLQRTRRTMLTLCLDLDDRPSDSAEAAFIAHSRNPGNRWFHASLQIVVFANAKACGIYSFTAYLDGNIMMRASSELQRRAAGAPLAATPAQERRSSGPPAPVPWELEPRRLEVAEREYRRICDPQKATFALDGLGRGGFQRHGISPVQAFVVSLQLAARDLVGRCVNVEQFLTMSRYRCMDLVTPNVTTPEMIAFVERVVRGELDPPAFSRELRAVIHSMDECARAARSALPLITGFSLFLRSRPRVWRLILGIAVTATMGILQITGRLRRGRREVVISHPAIFPEVPVMGRPGIRLPYARYFGLHYQIFEAQTVITMMPGVTWTVPNETVIAMIQQNLQMVLTMLDKSPPAASEEGRD